MVVAQHERGLDHVGERGHLCVAKHQLEHREDTLGGRRVGSERPDDLHRERPRWELLAVVRPPEQDALSELVNVGVVEGGTRALGEVGAQLKLERRHVLGEWRDGSELALARTFSCVKADLA